MLSVGVRGDCLRTLKTIKLKKRRLKKTLTFKQTLLVSFIIFMLLTVQALWIIDRGIRPTILEIANMETHKLAMAAINYAIQGTLEEVDMEQLIEIRYDANGNVTTVGFDSNVYNRVVTEAITNVQHYIKLMEKGYLPSTNEVNSVDNDHDIDVVYEIPLGRVTKNTLLSQLGPRIPVKLTALGEVHADLNEHVQASGINNTWIRVSLDLDVQMQIIIPFATDITHVVTTIPVGMVYISGKVPHYYGGGYHQPLPAILMEEEKDAP